MPVITIGRSYGAGGETVGHLVAERLGLDLIDGHIWEEVARRLSLTEDEVKRSEEEPTSLLDRVLTALGAASGDLGGIPETAWSPPYGDLGSDPREAVLKASQEVIKEAARAGDVVIVGRGASFVLGPMAGCLHCFMHAPEAARVAWARTHLNLGEETALRRVRHMDANRSAYIKQVYNQDWMQLSNYHLTLDTARLGYEAAADVVCAAIR